MSGSSSNPTTIPRTATATSGVSLPSQTGSLKIPSRPMHPEQDMYQEEDPRLATSLMGTSLPITIPIRPDSPSRDGDALRKSSEDKFVPPHLLERVGDDDDMSEVFSPSSMRREQLLRRNDILRSTGFIEVKKFTAPTGELIDAVKEAAMAKSEEYSRRGEDGAHPVRASSLTAALGT
jgi:hypothetical protein